MRRSASDIVSAQVYSYGVDFGYKEGGRILKSPKLFNVTNWTVPLASTKPPYTRTDSIIEPEDACEHRQHR